MNTRALRFWLIQNILLPPGLLLLKLWIRSYRLRPEDVAAANEIMRLHPRICVAFLHGSSIGLLPLSAVMRAQKRPLTVLTSPSRDGQTMDRVLNAVGIDVVKGSSKTRAAAGARDLMEALERGGTIANAVDGPRGPVMVPKPGIVRIAQGQGATLLVLTVGCDRFIQFKKAWDRFFIPVPFSHLRYSYIPIYIPDGDDPDAVLTRLEATLRQQAIALGSPIPQEKS